MMLFGKDDLARLEQVFREPPHAMALLRAGGFAEQEEAWLTAKVLGENSYANLIRLLPEDGKKGVGAAQIRAMVTSLSMGSKSGGERRLVVINDNYAFGEPAQNALLKMLEEPPEGVYFLLLASSADFFLPTIISRSAVLNLGGPEEDELVAYAKGELDLSETDARLLWMQAGRAVGPFLSLSVDKSKKQRSLKLLGDAKKFVASGSYERLVLLKPYGLARQEALDFAASLLVVLEIVASKGAKETLAVRDLVSKSELVLKNIMANGNPKLELTSLVI